MKVSPGVPMLRAEPPHHTHTQTHTFRDWDLSLGPQLWTCSSTALPAAPYSLPIPSHMDLKPTRQAHMQLNTQLINSGLA